MLKFRNYVEKHMYVKRKITVTYTSTGITKKNSK